MKTEDEIVKITDPIKLLKEIEAFFTFNNPPSEKDVRLIRASINYCVDNIPSPQETIKDESPVLPSEITDEEIRKAADDAYKGTDGLLDAYGTAGFEKGANWYRSQLKSQKATPQVSDMDIRNAFIEKYKGLDGLAEAYKEAGFIEGAKAMRDGKIKSQNQKQK
jgi:hypothetical protein